MKPTIITAIPALLLWLIPLTAHAQPINWDSVRADYITKYQPLQLPAWLFPIIFEEGGGQRDTIYLGYDKDALPNFGETWFGEIFQPVDTSRFNVSICLDFSFDSIYKVSISPLQNTSQCGDASFSISFYKGTLPLTMYWDREAFYSDSLPFADQAPAPRVQGELGAYMYSGDPNGMYCPETDFVLLSDTSLAYGSSDGICTATDSLVFFDLFGGSVPSVIYSFGIRPWTGYPPLGISPSGHDRILQAFPNPASGMFNLVSHKPGHIRIVNIYGHSIYHSAIAGRLHIDVSHHPPGIYYTIYQGNNIRHVLPIVLTK